MSKDDIPKLLSIPLLLGGMYGSYDDFIFCGNDKLMGYSVGLVGEIDDLLDKGYSKDEISEMIKESSFDNPDLTKEESTILKNHSYHLLDIRYGLFIENKPPTTEDKGLSKTIKNTNNS